ncbi:helix-turn-helix domain-containing protein [Bradyrhizobium sp. TZ2]
MRFSDLLDRTEAKKLTQEAASELLGINVRTFQRWAERFEAEGDDGLVDRRLGGDRQGGRRRKNWSGCWGCSGTSTRTSR